MARPRTRVLYTLLAASAAGAVALGAAPASAQTSSTSGTVGTVDSGSTPLNIRSAATTASAVVGQRRSGSRITLICQVTGQTISGRVRTTNVWDRTSDGRYISNAYIRRGALATCSNGPTPSAPTPVPTVPAPTAPVSSTIGTVDSDSTPLNIRSAATTASAVVGQLRSGSRITLICQVTGQTISGRVRTTNIWDKTSDGRYVSNAYIHRGALATCATAPTPSAPTPPLPPQAGPGVHTGWVVPVPGAPVQLFRPASNPTHDGVDIMEPRGTPIVAASAGRVVTVECNTSGPSCDVDGGPTVRGCGWYLEIEHAGQVTTRYCHLVRRPIVALGQQVSAGQVIGYVGMSGNAGAPHLHFEVHLGPGYATSANAVDPVAFMQRMNAPLAS